MMQSSGSLCYLVLPLIMYLVLPLIVIGEMMLYLVLPGGGTAALWQQLKTFCAPSSRSPLPPRPPLPPLIGLR